MSKSIPISRSRDEDGIVVLHLHDEAEQNALYASFVERLTGHLAAIGEDPQAKVLVLRGLQDVFCSGGHRDMLLDLAAGKVAATDIMLTRAILEVPLPTIAAMEGHAIGGGLILGLCCDLALMARESRYGCSFMNMGFTPGMGTTRLLQLAVGEYVAAEMMFGGQFFRGSQLAERSSVNYVLPKSQVLSRAMSIAGRIAEKPRGSLVLLKRSLSLKRRQLFEEARTTETMMHELSFAQPETAKLIEEEYPRAHRARNRATALWPIDREKD